MLFSRVMYGHNTFPDYRYDMTGFQFPHPVAMLAWKPGENSESGHFYAMQEAYDLGLLTRNDIQSMYDLYYDRGPFEDLDEETKTRITAWFWDNVYRFGEEPEEPPFEDLDEERKSWMVSNFVNYYNQYLGIYHDYVILLDVSSWDSYSGDYNIFIYDFEFPLTKWSTMYAWHKGNGCAYIMEWSTSWAEDQGWVEDQRWFGVIDYKDFLTEKDAKSMWERYILYENVWYMGGH